MKEGLFLYEHGVPPYNGGVCHQVGRPLVPQGNCEAPLLLALFSIVGSQDMAIAIVFSAVDILCARYLTIIASEKEEKWKIAAQFATPYRRNMLTGRFLFNPFTLATCLGRSSSVFSNLAVLASIAHAHQGTHSLSPWLLTGGLGGSAMVELAMASYLSLYPALLLPPLLLCRNLKVAALISQYSLKMSISKLSAIFILALLAVLALSYVLVGSWSFLASTYGVM